ncbi:MAG: DUF2330 domain-containing protein [Deltaproteobacteria bacterium]|nr:DUF2330 domain-containing protein [Deltaproteobacteria bacterium]
MNLETLRQSFRDPRIYQITILGSLLVYGLTVLDFGVSLLGAATLLSAALTAQAVFSRWFRLPRFDPRSPLISGLSLCLLLRTNSLAVAVGAAFLAIGSKFLLRRNDKHIFNPTAFGLAASLLIFDQAWMSPGQWGHAAFFAFLAAGFGCLVIHRARRSDVTYAFLAATLLIALGRALWLGDPWTIPLHQLQNGAVLIFAFFMISDPKTTPDSRPGRILYAALVATVAATLQFRFHQPNSPLWALVASAPLVPLLDHWLPGHRYRWPGFSLKERPMKTRLKTAFARPLLCLALLLASALPASAFCGFYVAKADSKLFNQASQVVLVRDGDRTVITMANDYRGDLADFAVVIPVPTFLEREQIHVAESALLDHLDAYSAPRLVEYFDPNPCQERLYESKRKLKSLAFAPESESRDEAAAALGVSIEASYSVGEYDILILSAEESDGLVTWLHNEGYRLPEGAEPVVASYLKQGMRFFVARVNLDTQAELGVQNLRPLQVAFESPKFMLPIRLGTVNADGAQDLIVYTLTRRGRVETTNYRTVRLPTGMELPAFLKEPASFADFYRDMFARQVEKERRRAVFLEYAWDMAWCDPCAADPLSAAELRQLGVFWLPENQQNRQAQNVFLTRLHVRYDGEHFPEDLRFQETGDRTNFQGRYVLRHAWKGKNTCPAAETYHQQLSERYEREAIQLASLTGWQPEKIRQQMGIRRAVDENEPGQEKDEDPWWKRVWGR